MSCLIQNLPTVMICLGLCSLVALIVVSMIRDKKKGKSPCSGCSCCAMSGECHKKHE